MTYYRTLLSSILLASSLGVLAAPLVADARECGHKGPHGEFREHRHDRMEQHHKNLHDVLKLTADQEGAWKKLMEFEHSMVKREPMKHEDWAKLSTPERADKTLDRMKEELTHMTKHVADTKEFYALLTPEQKKTFDDSHPGPRCDMRGKHESRSTGHGPVAFVKDSVITTKIKAKLAEEKISSLVKIQVDTDNKGVVVLSGKVKTQEQADKAVSIARDTEGVTSVKSNIRIKKDD